VAEPSLPPYNIGDLAPGARREAPAAARNRDFIAQILDRWLPARGVVLEIASGTGEHALAFSRRYPQIDWQPSDPDPDALASIAAWRTDGPANLLAPVALDVADNPWEVTSADAIVCINMVHISPWESSLGLLDGAKRLLGGDGSLILYGPWIVEGETTAPSNLAFDESLRARDPRWGLRLLGEFSRAAETRGFTLDERVDMPANNLMLRFVRA
jgi:SAM-dependent methyltransferase